MVHLEKISHDELKSCIQIAFEGDNDLINNYHIIAPNTLDNCVQNTLDVIKQDLKQEFMKWDIELLKVMYGNECIGFTIMIYNQPEPHFVTSFGINVEYRTKGILLSWLKIIEQKAGNFVSVLWAKNDRAIDFFIRNGYKRLHRKDREDICILSKNLEQCQQVVY